MNKPSPLANLKGITPEQSDQLFELLRGAAYHVAVRWVAENWGIPVSVAGLQRWWKRETARRARNDLRNAIAVSNNFDSNIDARQLDARAANAIRAAMWNAITTRDVESIKALGYLVLDFKRDARDDERLTLNERAQQTKDEALRLAREKFEYDAAKRAMEQAALIKGIQADNALDDDAKIQKVREALFGEVPR